MEITRQYVTIDEASVITGLSRSTICRRVRDGSLPRVKWSGINLIPIKVLMPEEACENRR